ncbi:hypothetical protein BGX38DRAFT_1244983, partial [Terfezia claveryi]
GESEGSDEEVRNYCSDAESDGESQQSEALNTITQPVAVDYRLARFFNAVHASEKKIDQFFKNGILQALNPTHRVQFQSAHTMYKLVDKAADEPCWYSGKVDYPLLKGVQFRYRNIISAVKYLLRQKVYAADMVWGPRREYDKQGNRIYSEMNTGTWWEDAQLSLPERGTLVPILLASDQTHLTNFSGDKKLWPLLKPLADTACQKGYEMICADGNIRLCFPKLFCWLADHMENATLHGITSNRCPTCIIPTEKLGEYSETSFLEHHNRIIAFDYVWHRLPPYSGFSVPSKAYRVISQWSGKEMRNFSKARPTGAQIQEFNRAIRCVRSITDFYLMTQYDSHTDETISYLEKYLCVFHETKDKVKLRQGNTFERRELVDEILKEGSHYNFPKIHLISHYAEQIPKFGCLPSSNRVDAFKIVTTYTRDHTFAMKDLAIGTWTRIRQGTRGQIFLTRDVKCTDSDIQRLLEGNIRAYKLDIPVPKLSGNGFVVHHARCTGLDIRPGTLNGRIPGRLNALFKLKSKEGIVYRVANVSLLQCIGGSSVQGAEGMLRVGWGGRER